MTLTKEQREEFEKLATPLIAWLNVPENAHPHCHVVIDSMHAELSEGVCAFTNSSFIRD